MRGRIKRIALLGILAAMAIALSLLESLFAPILPPGVKPGLSNVIVMTVAMAFSVPSALAIIGVKAFFAWITRGTVAFLMSLLAGLASALVTSLLIRRRLRPFGYIGISVMGAVVHNSVQLALAYILIGGAVWFYLPVLLLAGISTGAVTGVVMRVVQPLIRKRFQIGEP